MRWPTLVGATILTFGLTGCGFFGGDEEETASATQIATPTDTSTQANADLEEAPPLQQEAAATAPREPRARPIQTARDEPWTPTDTGTVSPGMTRDQVVAVWGVPMVERSADNWLYLYYRNGCAVTCGTDDVVLLQDGQVVDAIVRGAGHTYSGVSSSPPGRTAEATLPTGGVG